MLRPDIAETVTYTINVNVNDSDAGTATVIGNNSVIVDEGTTITMSATPNEGYKFISWTIEDRIVSTEPVYTTVASESMTITANFEADESTSINPVEEKTENVTYDLSGRKVKDTERKRIYIVNGHTVLKR